MSIESGSGVRIAYPSSWRVPQNRPCLNSLSGQSKDALEGRKRGGPLRSSTFSLQTAMRISAEFRRGTTVHLTTSSGSIVRATSAASRSADIGRYPLCRTDPEVAHSVSYCGAATCPELGENRTRFAAATRATMLRLVRARSPSLLPVNERRDHS